MTTLHKIYAWLAEFECKWGEPPKDIPITKAEKLDITSDSFTRMTCAIAPKRDELFGVETDLSPFADSIRQRRLEIYVGQCLCEYSFEDILKGNLEFISFERPDITRQVRQLKLRVLTDHTVVRITLECDPFAWLKRMLHITKWFPVKQITRDINCEVLYPLCKVTLPHNKHTVHFSAR